MKEFFTNLTLTTGGQIYFTIVNFLDEFVIIPTLIIIAIMSLAGIFTKKYSLKQLAGHSMNIWLIFAFILTLTRLVADEFKLPFTFWNDPWYKLITWFILDLFHLR